MENYLQLKKDNSQLNELTGFTFTGVAFVQSKSVNLSGIIVQDAEQEKRLTELILLALNNNQVAILEMVKKESENILKEAKAIAVKQAEDFIAQNK